MNPLRRSLLSAASCSTAIAVALGMLVTGFARAETVRSTIAGGPWHQVKTWIGGNVPDSADDVIVDGPVRVHGSETCASLETSAAGTVRNGTFSTSTLEVTNGIVNAGTIENGQQTFHVRVGGNIHNQGTWSNARTVLTGTSDQHLTQAPSATFQSDLGRAPSATGNLLIDTPFALEGDIDLMGGRIVLGPDCPLTLEAGFLSGDIQCHGNEVRFESYSYLLDGVMDAGVLVGSVHASSGFSFTGGLTVMDELTHTVGGSHLRIEGTLTNYGLIYNDNYGLTIDLAGDLECYGTFTNSYIALDGSQVHHVRMNEEANLRASVFLPEFEPGTLVIETDADISDGIGLGIDGTMVLMPGVAMRLAGGSINGGTVLGQGNDIYMDETSSLRVEQADGVILHGIASIGNGTSFTSGLQVLGTFQNWRFASSEITVDGAFINDGHVRNNEQLLTIRARGDVINHGLFENARVELDGPVDQRVEIGDGIDVAQFVLSAGFSSTAYQWFRDGVAIPSEESDELLFTGLDVDDVGIYHCEGAQGQVSRFVVIGQGVATEVPESPVSALLQLAPVWPNPFRARDGGATIEFFLPEAGRTKLSVFDVCGREVSVISDGDLDAGYHSTSWTPVDASSGVYFVRVQTPAGEAGRSVILLE